MILNGKGQAIRGRMSMEQKRDYARAMSERETRQAMSNPTVVNRDAQKYRDWVKKQQEMMGIKGEI
jgi:hypothetical protein